MDILKLHNLEELDLRKCQILTDGKMLPFVKFGSFWLSNAAQVRQLKKKKDRIQRKKV
jgi:hypothetical protein